jgi:hypothetical protein
MIHITKIQQDFYSCNTVYQVDCHSNHPRSTFTSLISVFFMQQHMMSVCLSVQLQGSTSLHHTSVRRIEGANGGAAASCACCNMRGYLQYKNYTGSSFCHMSTCKAAFSTWFKKQ